MGGCLALLLASFTISLWRWHQVILCGSPMSSCRQNPRVLDFCLCHIAMPAGLACVTVAREVARMVAWGQTGISSLYIDASHSS